MSAYNREPPDPEGGDPIAVWCRQFKAYVMRMRLVSVKGGKMIPDAGGGYHLVIPQAKPQAAAASGGSSSINVRGEWDPAAAYALFDFVVISMGLNQGTYVAMLTNTGVNPTTGAPNWLQLPGGLLGQWM